MCSPEPIPGDERTVMDGTDGLHPKDRSEAEDRRDGLF